MLYNKDIKKGKANSMKYIEDRIAELAEGKKSLTAVMYTGLTK